jgi:hypothetical protein
MRRIFYVDLVMCGGESLPKDFDLEEFCEVLQGKVQEDIEVVPMMNQGMKAVNFDPALISTHIFNEALGEYYHR